MTAITRYITWAERQLAAVIEREGLAVACAGVTQGPLTITFRLRLLSPTRANLGRLLALGPTIAQATHCNAVRVADTAGGVMVELPTPAPRTPAMAELATHTRGLTVAIGYDAMRQPVTIDFAAHPHLLAVGPTRRGKTEAIKSLLYGMASQMTARRLLAVILAKKTMAWAAYDAAALTLGLYSDDAAIKRVLAHLAGHVLPQRAAAGDRWPAIMIVCDDLANMGRADIAGELAELASMGGGLGLHLIISTQATGRAGGLTVGIEANMAARLVYGATDAAAAARYAGAGGTGADTVGSTPGDALLILDGIPQRVATAKSDDRLIALLPRAHRQNRENWQNQQNHPTPWGEGTHPTGGGVTEPVTEPLAELPVFDLAGPITAKERAHVAALFAALGSKNKACVAAYGHKNGRTWERLQLALQDAPTNQPTQPTYYTHEDFLQ